MSVNVVKDKGVTVITVASDSKSALPPLCQILKALCYSPVCCSVYQGLMQTSVVSALGAVQIMVGLFNLGVGPGRISLHPEDFAHLGVAYWLGGVFIAVGVMSVLAGRFPALLSVCFAVFLNIVGAIFAIVGIVMYAIDLGDVSFANMCDWSSYGSRSSDDNCRFVAYYAQVSLLLKDKAGFTLNISYYKQDICAIFFISGLNQRMVTAMDITMIILVTLQLCVCISLSVLGIKALHNRKKVQVDTDVEIYQPVLNKDLMTSPGA